MEGGILPRIEGGARRGRMRILSSGRVPLLRRGHSCLALLVYGVHLLSRDSSASNVLVAGLLAILWFAVLRVTLLSESRASPSWAVQVVRASEATLAMCVIVPTVKALVGLNDPVVPLVLTTVELGVLAYLWQVAVAGHHALGEPLRCVVIGPAAVARKIQEERLAPGARPFSLVGWLEDGDAEDGEDVPRVTRLGTTSELEAVALRDDVDVFIIGVRGGRPSLYARLLDLTHLDVRVIEFPAFFEREFGRVPLEELTPTWFLHAMHLNRRDESWLIKRTVDVVGSAVGLLLAAPLFAATALAVRLTSPGPILFRQIRIGEHGRPFMMLKFRSMRDEPDGDHLTWTGDDDPRITSAGKIIRKFRLDELPQLVNVLRGEMTLVGPRPETPRYVVWLEQEIPFYKPRHFAKPGITGWAQVCAGYASSVENTREKLSYDLYYLRNRSLTLDLAIMLRTVAIMLRGRGSW